MVKEAKGADFDLRAEVFSGTRGDSSQMRPADCYSKAGEEDKASVRENLYTDRRYT